MDMKVQLRAFVNGNLGDDLFVKIICNRYKNCTFYLSGNGKYKKYFRRINNLKYFSNDIVIMKAIFKIFNTVKKIFKKERLGYDEYISIRLSKKCEEHVLITGSFFMEPETGKSEVERKINNDKKLLQLRPYILGCNFGPYFSELFYNEYKRMFSMAKSICFRDSYSYDLFMDLKNVSWAPDVVFNLNIENTFNGNYYIISVVNLKKDDNEKSLSYYDLYVKKLVEIITELKRINKKVVLMSFCDDQGDMKTIQDILILLNNKDNVEVLSYNSIFMEKSLEIISNCEAIIATRFHAMILGFLYKKPVFPIIYNRKMKYVLKDLNYDKEFIEIKDMHNLEVKKLINTLNDKNIFDIKQTIIDANNQFSDLDNVFK